MSTPEDYEALREYVQEQLKKAGIDDWNANPINPRSIAANIVAEAWRQPRTKETADSYIEIFKQFPPSPINKNHFSLKAYLKLDGK
jgi:hypothetical protein